MIVQFFYTHRFFSQIDNDDTFSVQRKRDKKDRNIETKETEDSC